MRFSQSTHVQICFVFGDFNIHDLTALISNDLTQIVNFSTWVTDCDRPSPALLDFLLSMVAFDLQWPSLPWEILIMLLSQFPLTFRQTEKGMSYSIA